MTRHTDPRLIEASLAAHRSALADTLDVLKDRLAPVKIAQDVVDTISRQATGFATSTGRMMRANPLAFAMTGLGLGWILFGRRPEKHLRPVAVEDISRWEDEGGTPLPEQGMHQPVTAESLAARASANAARLSRSVKAQAARRVDDTPLIFGAAALILGVVAAVALRPSQTEDDLFGAESDLFHKHAADLLRAQEQRLRDLLGEVTQTVTQGLQSGLAAATEELSDTIDKVGDQVSAGISKP